MAWGLPAQKTCDKIGIDEVCPISICIFSVLTYFFLDKTLGSEVNPSSTS